MEYSKTIKKEEDITVKNVRGGGEYAVALAGEIKNLVMYGIECFEGTKILLDKRGENEN